MSQKIYYRIEFMKNYIGNNNQINKKKYKKSLSPFCNLNAGNVEFNINTFNKMSDSGFVPSSAEGMSGMVEDYDRNEIITEIRSYGYPFDRYNLKEKSDAALFNILKSARELQKDKIRYKPKRKNTIDINTDCHIMNDDTKYNFDDPDRVGEYKVENLTIREQLNRLDKRAFNNDEVFYDLRSIYEGIEHRLSSQEKAELKNLLNTTNDADTVKAYLDSKDPNKKNEDLDDILMESTDNLTYDELIELAHKYYKQGGAEIIEFWDENSLREYEKEFGPMTKDIAISLMKVMGNVTDDEEAAGEYFSKQTYENYSVRSNSATDSVDVVNNDTDEIVSRHHGETALESANKEKDIMNMNEEFNWDDLSLDIYIDEFKEADDIEDLEDIVHEIYSYNKPLFVKLRHFPKDASFEELRDNKIKILQAEKNKVKEPKEVKKSLFVIKDKHGNQLSSPNEDQDELWDRVSAMEQRGRRGLKVVAYVEDTLKEDYTKEDEEWGDPYTFDEIYDQLEKITHKFKEKKGTVRCWYNQEKIFGIQILKDYYEDVGVSDAKSEDNDERYWVITYSNPKKEDEE